MELVGKFADAASMFWQALDDRERMMLLYGAVWVLVAVLAGVRSRDRDRLKAEILEELVAGGGARS